MSVLFLSVPVALLLAVLALWGFVWSVQDGQLDDLDSPPERILLDDN
jgi:cbb3-type cytochrome oxidase maturation protein